MGSVIRRGLASRKLIAAATKSPAAIPSSQRVSYYFVETLLSFSAKSKPAE
jgi:hypothetical protein